MAAALRRLPNLLFALVIAEAILITGAIGFLV
jgi:hypothetical protein